MRISMRRVTNMKKILLSLSVAILLPFCVNAQNEDEWQAIGRWGAERLHFWTDMALNLSGEEYLQAYAASMDSLDISITCPTDFEPYASPDIIFCPDTSYRAEYYNLGGIIGFSFVGPAFVSPSKDAVILYPLCVDNEIGMSPAWQMEKEMIAAHRNEFIDITGMFTVTEDTGDTNADWILQYDYDVATPEWGEHPHCVGLALRKKNHYAMPIKLLLNDEGLKHKDEYIALALASVKYGDHPNPKPEWQKMENELNPDELKFPKEKHKFVPGIIK